jgi:hypothetical protein
MESQCVAIKSSFVVCTLGGFVGARWVDSSEEPISTSATPHPDSEVENIEQLLFSKLVAWQVSQLDKEWLHSGFCRSPNARHQMYIDPLSSQKSPQGRIDTRIQSYLEHLPALYSAAAQLDNSHNITEFLLRSPVFILTGSDIPWLVTLSS